MIRLFFSLLLLFPMTVTAGTILPEISDSKYVDYGNQHKCIVKLSGKLKNSNAFMSGSAVVIKPRWVLTAAHVVQGTENEFVLFNDKKINIDQIIINVNFDHEKTLSNSDIALCHVVEDIDLDFYPSLYSDQDELNKVCSISGYGITGTANTGAIKHDDKKRAGSNIVIEASEYLLKCDMSRKNTTSLEFLIASGDSGGGLFINNKLAGINSFVSSATSRPNSSFGNESFHTRISNPEIYAWIVENAK